METRDSLSRCNYESNNFYNIHSPKIRRDPEASTVIRSTPKDTLELSKDQLKKDALNRLRHTSDVKIESSASSSVMRIGKYLFLAVSVPPYMLLYGIPKWLLVEGLPVLFKFSLTILETVAKSTQKQIKKVQQRVIEFVYKVQSFFKRLIQPIVKLGLTIQHTFYRFRKQVMYFFNRTASKAKALFSFQSGKERLTRLFKNMAASMQQAAQAVQKGTQVLISPLVQGFSFFKALPKKIGAQMKGSLRPLSRLKKIAAQWKQHFTTSQQLSKQATDWLASRFSRNARSFKNTINKLRTTLSNTAKPLLKYLKSSGNKIGRFLGDKTGQFKKWLRQAKSRQQEKWHSKKLTVLFPPALYNWIPQFFREIFKKWIWNSLYFVLQLVSKGIRYCWAGIKNVFGFIVRCPRLIWAGLKQGFKYLSLLKNSAGMLWRKGCHFLKVGVYWFLLVLIMTGILAVRASRLLARTGHRLITGLTKGLRLRSS